MKSAPKVKLAQDGAPEEPRNLLIGALGASVPILIPAASRSARQPPSPDIESRGGMAVAGRGERLIPSFWPCCDGGSDVCLTFLPWLRRTTTKASAEMPTAILAVTARERLNERQTQM
jgi:hypothetical protein